MDRHEEGGAPDKQPPQEVQIHQQLSDSTPLEAALVYATRGWPVLPLHSVHNGECTCGAANCQSPGKHPRTANGIKDATTDLEQIKQWWTYWPEANIGIATGAASGLLVVDVDPRNGGKESLERLQEAHGPFDTYTVSSGGAAGISISNIQAATSPVAPTLKRA
jgi:Bifunctional DNA primase/polymerase, N-terminal